MKYLITLLVCVFLNADDTFNISKVVSVKGIPWGMTFLDENIIIISQKHGDISIFNEKDKKIIKIPHNLDIFEIGQGGLLDIKVSKDYLGEKKIFVTYTKNLNGVVTVLATAKFNKNFLNFKDLFITESGTNTGYHFGSRIVFDNLGYIYFSVGDRGKRENAQSLGNHIGKILRVKMDGTIPKDNPFNTKTKLSAIYSLGHRNPQGLFYNTNHRVLYAIEHGPRGGDEINVIKKGLNYGWPVISYGKEYTSDKKVGIGEVKDGMESPLYYFTPSIAPSSILIYSGKLFKNFKGDIFSGSLKLRHLNHVILENGKVVEEKRYLQSLNERIRNVIESPKGEIYLGTDNGNIYKITPK